MLPLPPTSSINQNSTHLPRRTQDHLHVCVKLVLPSGLHCASPMLRGILFILLAGRSCRALLLLVSGVCLAIVYSQLHLFFKIFIESLVCSIPKSTLKLHISWRYTAQPCEQLPPSHKMLFCINLYLKRVQELIKHVYGCLVFIHWQWAGIITSL